MWLVSISKHKTCLNNKVSQKISLHCLQFWNWWYQGTHVMQLWSATDRLSSVSRLNKSWRPQILRRLRARDICDTMANKRYGFLSKVDRTAHLTVWQMPHIWRGLCDKLWRGGRKKSECFLFINSHNLFYDRFTVSSKSELSTQCDLVLLQSISSILSFL